MSIISIPFTFSAGAVIIASQHNSNFGTIVSDYNGFIDNNNISTSAAIAYSKLNLTGTILNSDLAGSITDSKLSQITTPGKVSGTSLTLLASTTTSAGRFPMINLASGTNTSAYIFYGDQVLRAAPSVLSNVLFQYQGVIDGTAGASGDGETNAATLTPVYGVTTIYRFLATSARNIGSGAGNTVWSTKWIKISGVNTITIYTRLWVAVTTGSGQPKLTVAIGSASGSVSATAGLVTPTWYSFTIDVSGLSNGTTYDVTASLGNINDISQEPCCANVVAFGS